MRRSFWLTVLAGAGGSGLAAYAGAQDWVRSDSTDPLSTLRASLDSPATTSLALVALAAWGVVLVTRGRVRRAVAALGGLAALAPLLGVWSTRSSLLEEHAGTSATAWPWVAAAGCLLAAAAGVVAVLRAPTWPEMGRKYDAPGATGEEAPASLDEQSNLDIWKALDEGRDPT